MAQKSILDRLPPSALLEFDDFRKKKFHHTYLCNNCHRAYDTVDALEKCKFCGSDRIKQLQSLTRIQRELVHEHYCPNCGTYFVSNKEIAVCPNCRSEYLKYTLKETTFGDRLVFSARSLAERMRAGRPNIQIRQKRPFSFRSGEELPSR